MLKEILKDKKKTTILILNMVLVIFGIMGLVKTFTGLGNFAIEYYTQLSNYFGLIANILFLIFFIKNADKLPKWISILKYSATLSMTLTFLVVLFILTPMYGFKEIFVWIFFEGANIFYHTLCPILMFTSFTFFEEHNIKGLKDNLRAIYFTIAYAIVFITLNILKLFNGPYPFLQVYNQPIYMSIIWFILIVGGAFGIGKGIMLVKNRQ